MIKIFYGDDRVKAQEAIKKWLGADYEVIEGSELAVEMMPSIFFGTSLLAEKRRIVIKDLAENKEAFAKLADYLSTEHEVAIFENSLDKRTVAYKSLAKAGVEMREFKTAAPVDMREVFDIYNTALRDGARAVKMLEKVQDKEEPYMFVGLLATQAIKNFEMRGGVKEREALRKLAELDLNMKNTSIEPWMLVKSFLLNLK